MNCKFKPMLAGKAPSDPDELTYPLYVSPKLDGIRCLIQNGVAVSRSLKPIPNQFIQEQLRGLPHGLDGELMLGRKAGYNAVQSAVMSRDGAPDFMYFVFDWHTRDQPYAYRYQMMVLEDFDNEHVWVVPHKRVVSSCELMHAEHAYLYNGYEGLMIRSLDGLYKEGRSTTRQGWLLKMKRFDDAEATVVDVQEHMHNGNEATVDNLGHTKRSSVAAGMVPTGKLGALVCHTKKGLEFSIGTGFTDAQRIKLWGERSQLLGKLVTYKHQPSPSGEEIAPRFPVFLRFREKGC